MSGQSVKGSVEKGTAQGQGLVLNLSIGSVVCTLVVRRQAQKLYHVRPELA